MTPADAWRNQGQSLPAQARVVEGPPLPPVPPTSNSSAASTVPVPAAAPSNRPEERVQLDWIDALVRHKRWAFAIVMAVYLACFNGFWRVGLDSALYRSLARSIVEGRGYTVAGEPHHHAFAGMPLLLAGLQKVFGESAFPAVVMVTLMAFAMLGFVYRLIALRYPIWVATVVTIGVGLNFRIIRQSQELMTDIPFALGVVASFYGLERLRLTARDGPLFRKANLLPAIIMMGGLALSAAMRPTFGVLGGAILVAACYRLLVNTDGRRSLHATIVACVCVVTVGLLIADPRTSGRSPLKGGIYEQELIEGVRDLHTTIWVQLDDLLARDLNDAFYSQDMAIRNVRLGPVAPFGLAASAILLAATYCVMRRDLAWGLCILGIMAVTLPLSTVPRYFIMVMPFLWLGWVLLLSNLTLRAPAQWRGAVMMLGLLIPVAMNFGRTTGLMKEQRTAEIGWLNGAAPDRETAFFNHYRDGSVHLWKRWAKMIHDHVPPDARVIGPEANVLAYFSNRRVFGERAIFLDRPIRQYPAILNEWKPIYALFPGAVYSDADSRIRDLISRRILAKGDKVAEVAKAYLSYAEVRLPRDPENWRAARDRQLASDAAVEPATQPATRPAVVKKPTKPKKKPAATQSTVTRSTEHAATQPATTKKRKKKPARPTAAPTSQPAVITTTTRPAAGKSTAEKRDARLAREAREARIRREQAATRRTAARSKS